MRTLPILLFLPAIAQASPLTFTHQGRLIDSAGVPVSGAHQLHFALHDDPASGATLWSETVPATLTNGFYAVVLGESSPIDPTAFTSGDLWLSLAVDTEPALSPRTELSAVPWALVAQHAHSATTATTATTADGLANGATLNVTSVSVGGTEVISSAGTIDYTRLVNTPSAADNDTLGDLVCSDGDVAVFSGLGWDCGAPGTPDHEHDAADLTSGTLDAERLPGATAGDFAVNGTLTIGDGEDACTAEQAGALRWADNDFWGCNGRRWVSLTREPVGSTAHNAGRDCADVLAARPTAATGLYWIKPGSVPAFQAWCDMTTDGGGWTLVAKIHRNGGSNYDEPDNWFSQVRDESALWDGASYKDRAIFAASHGTARLGALQTNAGLARFTMIAEDDENQRISWYKRTAADLHNWFSDTDHAATQVCSNLGMTANCSNGKIGGAPNIVTNLDGMSTNHHGFTGGVIHLRQNTDPSPSFGAVCSSTGSNNGNAWNDNAFDGHWGNGLEIWVR